MKKSNYLKTGMLLLTALLACNTSFAQCTVPVITTVSNDGPGCPGAIINLHAEGNIGGTNAGFTRMAGIGGNFGNQEFNNMFSFGDRPGSIVRISEGQFNSLAAGGAAALRANYDVLLFTWASDPGLNAPWSLIEAYLALGGSVFWEDEVNLSDLSPGIGGVGPAGTTGGCSYSLVNPAPFPVLVSNGVTGCFANDHLYLTSWPTWMQAYITASGRTLAIAGIHPTGGGRLIIQGPDQDFHASRASLGIPGDIAGNQYQFMLNQMDFLTAGQGGFTWSGPNGFTATGANAAVALSPTSAGVYTVTLTNTTGGGCNTTATTTVVLNATPDVYNVTGGGNYCLGTGGSSVGLSNSQTGVSYQLKLNGSDLGSPVSGTGAALDFGLQTSLGVYTVTAIGTSCSIDMNGDATVTSNKTAVITAGGPLSFCPESGVTLTAALTSEPYTTGSAASYLWSNSATTSSITTNQSGTSSVAVTLDNGCTTTSSNVTTEAYVTSLTATGDATICPGASTQLSAAGSPTATGGGTYNICIYDAPGGEDCTNGYNGNICDAGLQYFGSASSNTGTLNTTGNVTPSALEFKAYFTICSGPVNFIFKLNGNTIHTYSHSTANCYCVDASSGTFPMTFTIPLTSFESYWSTTGTNSFTVETSGGQVYFTGITATLTASSSAYSWSPSTGLNDATAADPIATPSATTTYTVTFTSSQGCEATDDVTVTVADPTPVPTESSLPTVTGECSVTVSSTPTATNCNGTWTGTTSDPLTYSTQGTHTITWTYSDGSGNTATQTQTVIVDDITNPTITAPDNVTVAGWCTNVPDASVTLGTASASDNCGSVTVTNNAPASYPVGTTSVVWTATDAAGNTSTATQTVTVTDITMTATSSVSPEYPFPGQELQTIYLNYTPSSAQSVVISATPTNGTSPYTYSWQRSGCNNTTMSNISNTASSYTFAPTSANICKADSDNVFQFVITVTDAHGCVVTQQKNINVVDPFSGNKIRICHIPSGEPNNPQLITVGAAAVASHLAHGDNLGNCFTFAGRKAQNEESEITAEELHFHVYPNPSNGTFTIELPKTGTTDVVITDVAGKVIVKQSIKDNAQQQLQYNLGNEAKGLYFIRVVNGGAVYQSKITLQ